MAAVVAAETAREIRMPDIVRVLAPGHVHFGKDVAFVDSQYLPCGGVYFRLALRPHGRIAFLVVFRENVRDAPGGIVAVAVIRLQDLHRLLFGKRQFR